MARNAKALNRLRSESERATKTLATAKHQLGVIARQDVEYAQQLAAMDTTIALVDTTVNPAVAGTVAAWAGRYGRRGELARYLRDALRSASPHLIPTAALVDMVDVHFSLDPFRFHGSERPSGHDSLSTCSTSKATPRDSAWLRAGEGLSTLRLVLETGDVPGPTPRPGQRPGVRP